MVLPHFKQKTMLPDALNVYYTVIPAFTAMWYPHFDKIGTCIRARSEGEGALCRVYLFSAY